MTKKKNSWKTMTTLKDAVNTVSFSFLKGAKILR